MPRFGNASKSRLETLRQEMALTASDAIKIIDFSIIDTARDEQEQNFYFATGASKVQWPDSKHNICEGRPLSEAMDLWPYVRPFGALSGHPSQIAAIARRTGRGEDEVRQFVYKAYARLGGVVEACAALRGYEVRWGGDWDGDGNLLDQDFHDLQHFEFVRKFR